MERRKEVRNGENKEEKEKKKRREVRREMDKRKNNSISMYCVFVQSPILSERESEWGLNEIFVYSFIFPKQETLVFKQRQG